MGHTILTINPGMTGTKIGVVKNGEVILDLNVLNEEADFSDCASFADQAPFREKLILEKLKENGIDIHEIDAISGRGGGQLPCEGGTYQVTDLVYDHASRDLQKINHPTILGSVIGYRMSKEFGIPAFFVDPNNTDELCDEARVTGVKGLYRRARSHMLNQRQVAINHSKKMGREYKESNYVVVMMGSGISINAHCHGRVIDGTRAGDGQAPISPTRTGDLCAADVFTLLERGKSLDEIYNLMSKCGGFDDLLGTHDLKKVSDELVPSGDRKAKLAWDAMEYGFVKWIATMAGALKGKVDGILLTGGLAYDKSLTDRIREDTQWIAPVYVYPGSFETEALAAGAERVLSGEETAKVYRGEEGMWRGFGIPEWEKDLTIADFV